MKVIWTKNALRSLEQAHRYVRESNPAAAAKMIRHIRNATESLGRIPNVGRQGIRTLTRELVIRGLPYIVVYRVTGDCIQVLRVFHQKQLRET